MSLDQGQTIADAASDDDFVSRIAAGDKSAEQEFMRRYNYGVRVLVRRHCRPGDPIADDLAQEVLARVLERLRAGALREASALPAYIQTTVIYTTGAEYRRRHAMEPLTAIENLASDDNPAEKFARQQLCDLLKTVLAEMPVMRDREILQRFYLSEHDKDDVCQQLGIDAAHFHRVLFRARERFRVLLEQAGIAET